MTRKVDEVSLTKINDAAEKNQKSIEISVNNKNLT